MASSLLFRIQSLFDNTGFREASASFASTLGWVGKLTVGIAQFAVQGKVLGRIFGVLAAIDIAKAGFGLLNFLLKAAPAAGRAEVTFNRLQTQLQLMGKGSKENIALITTFADTASRKTRFSSEEIQSSVTAAARRTGDLRVALKETAVAEDFAAATGMDLASATNILNRAQAGYTRILTQVTDLRQADIQQAVRQGTVLDLIGKKFAGAASKEAGTYAGKLALVANTSKQLQAEMGKSTLWIAKFGTDIKLLGLNTALFAVRGIGELQGGLIGLPSAFSKASKEAEAFRRAMAPGKEFTFNFEKALEVETARLGKTRDERQQITRDIARIEDILVIAEQSGADALTKEQLALVESYKWSSQQLASILSNRVEATRRAAKAQFDATRAQQLSAADRTGFMSQVKNIEDFIRGAKQAKIPVATIADELHKSFGISKSLATTVTQIGLGIAPVFDSIDKTVDSVKTKLAELSGSSNMDKLKLVSAELENIIKTQVQPKFNVKIDFNLPPEAIQDAVRTAVISGLPGLIASLFRNNATTASKETTAAAPLV